MKSISIFYILINLIRFLINERLSKFHYLHGIFITIILSALLIICSLLRSWVWDVLDAALIHMSRQQKERQQDNDDGIPAEELISAERNIYLNICHVSSSKFCWHHESCFRNSLWSWPSICWTASRKAPRRKLTSFGMWSAGFASSFCRYNFLTIP